MATSGFLSVLFMLSSQMPFLASAGDVGMDLSDTKVIEGVPIYNYHLANPEGGMHPSTLELSEQKQWIFIFGATSDEDERKYCQKTPGNAKCQASGHPSVGGIPMVSFIGNEEELTQMLRMHKGENPKYITPDSPTSAIPEIDVHENDGGGRLLEEAMSWGLDRIDDYNLVNGYMGDKSYNPTTQTHGEGAHVYVADTGIRFSHQDFEGRASPAIDMFFEDGQLTECQESDTSCSHDQHGHGTHCAGTVGGREYGVAKKTSLYAMKVLNNEGRGTVAGVIQSVDWVIAKGRKPAVWSASLGALGQVAAFEEAFQRAKDAGVTIVVAAGNHNIDACDFSPALAPTALTVGATTRLDNRAWFSNYGKCLDMFAPGERITSASAHSDTGSVVMSGTSMACPHVSGAAALLLGDNPNLSVDDVHQTLKANARENILSQVGDASPNLLVYVGPACAEDQVDTTVHCPLFKKFFGCPVDSFVLNLCPRTCSDVVCGPPTPTTTTTPTTTPPAYGGRSRLAITTTPTPATTPTPTTTTTPPATTTTTTTTVPGTCSFESDKVDGKYCGVWKDAQDGSDNFDWKRGTSTGSSKTGPNSAANGQYFLYLEASDRTSGSTAILETDTFVVSSTSRLDFKYHMYGEHMGSLIVTACWDHNGRPFCSNLWQKHGQQQVHQHDPWKSASVDLAVKFAGKSIKVAFKGKRGQRDTGDAAIDLVALHSPPPPTTTTTTTSNTHIQLNPDLYEGMTFYAWRPMEGACYKVVNGGRFGMDELQGWDASRCNPTDYSESSHIGTYQQTVGKTQQYHGAECYKCGSSCVVMKSGSLTMFQDDSATSVTMYVTKTDCEYSAVVYGNSSAFEITTTPTPATTPTPTTTTSNNNTDTRGFLAP